MKDLDSIVINFDEDKLFWLNIILSVVMYAVALEINWADFKDVFHKPKQILVGVSSQFLLLPIITLVFVSIVPMHPSIALGLFLISACPGGNVSNFYSMISKGNIALSVALTSIATISAGFMIPLGFMFWAGCSAKAAPLLSEVQINYGGMMKTTFWLLLVPMILGMCTRYFKPKIAQKISSPLKYLSIIIFAALVLIAFLSNLNLFLQLFNLVFWLTLTHNGLILFAAYFWARLFGLEHRESKTISLETGIQNTGIALVIAFNFFSHLGGLQIIVAWWGIWHLVSGGILSYIYARK
jgi:BASS family bile acid:Na+ symporter